MPRHRILSVGQCGYDHARISSFREWDWTFSLTLLHSRQRIATRLGDRQEAMLKGRKPTRRDLTGLGDFVIEKWATDPRIPEDHQLPDVFFTKDDGAWDKGHLVRRDGDVHVAEPPPRQRTVFSR